jgi:1-acyl-sn-glycerol-3-phosphate acyltransferase
MGKSTGAGRGGKELNSWWYVARATVGNAFRLALRLRFHHMERLPRTGAALVACNHISVLDPIILGIGVSDLGRTIRFLTAAEVFDKRLIGWGLRIMRQIPIRRGARDWGALEEAARVIRGGSLAGIFPEGRVSEHSDLQRGRKGAARLALAAGVPVVPVAIWGTQVRWPRSGLTLRRPWRPPVAVVVGHPVEALGDPRDAQAARALTDRMMGDLATLLPEARLRASSPNRA